jgi:predicted DNA-binding transcriptional regulator AlpA
VCPDHNAVAVGAIADLCPPLTFLAMSDNNAQVGRPGPTGPDPRERLTFEQVLAAVGVTRSTMDKWRARGAAPRFKRLPNGNLISRREWLDQWFNGLEDDPRWPGAAA